MKEQKLRIENEGLQPNCMFFGDDQEVFFVPFDSVINEISTLSNDISCAEQKHSDVVPGVYEGMSRIHAGEELSVATLDTELFRDQMN